MLRVITRVAILIVLVIATLLIAKGVANTIHTIPLLEWRIRILIGSLLGLLLLAFFLVWLGSKPTRNKRFPPTSDSWWQRLRGTIHIDPTARFTIIVTIVISATMMASAYYPDLVKWVSQYGLRFGNGLPQFITTDDRQFFINFIEWFGVFYGFVISGVLIKVWEQFANVERLFDKEAEAVSVLYENLMLLSGRFRYVEDVKNESIRTLRDYVFHVTYHYLTEHIRDEERLPGNGLLRKIRGGLYPLTHFERNHEEVNLPISELNGQLNNLMGLRGDRISGSKQRIYQSFRFLSIFISIMWLLPFYLLTDGSVSIIHQSLVTGVTFLVIFVLSVIEDLDDPFSGFWKLNVESWLRLKYELESESKYLQEKHFSRGEESSKPKNSSVNTPQADNSSMKTHALEETKESLINAELQVEVEERKVNESVVSHGQDSASRLNTKGSIIGSVLIAISIIVAAVIVAKRK